MSDLRLKKKNLGANIVDSTKVLFDNDTALRFKKADGSELEAIKFSSSDKLVLAAAMQLAVSPTENHDLVNKLYVDERFTDLIGLSPEELNSLEELAQALQNNPDIISSLNTQLLMKADLELDGNGDKKVLLVQIPELPISRIQDLGSALAGKASQVDFNALEQEVDQAKLDIDALELDMAGKASASVVSGIDTRLGVAEGEIDTLQSDMSAAQTAISGKASQVDFNALEQEVDQAKLDIDALELEMPNKADATVVSGINGRLVIAEGEIDTLQSDMSAANTAISSKASQSDFDDLDGYAQEIRSDLDDLDGYAQEIRDDHDAPQLEVNQAKLDIDALELDMAGKASASVVSGIDTRLGIAEGEIDTLQSDMVGKASVSSVSDLTGRVGLAEGEIDQLQLDLADKASQSDFDALYLTVTTEHDTRLDVAEQSISDLESGRVLKAGDSMSGMLSIADGSGPIMPVSDSDVAVKKYVDDQIDLATGSGSGVETALAGKADLVGGKVPESQIPAVAIVDTFEAASEAEMLALSLAEKGDVCIRSDLNKTFILSGSPYSELAKWKELRTPTDAVLSVAGKVGAVSLDKSDVGLGNVDNTSDADKPISTAANTALSGKANTALSNLGTTYINTFLYPATDGTQGVGSTTTAWAQMAAGAYLGRAASGQLTVITAALSRTVTFSVLSADITCSSAPNVSVSRVVHFTVSGGAMPGGLNANQRYYVKSISGSVMTVSSTLGGSAITITSAATGTVTAVFSQNMSLWAQNLGSTTISGYDIYISPNSVGGVIGTTSILGSSLNVSALLNMQNHIQPSASNLRDIGSSTKVFRDVFTSGIKFYGPSDGAFEGSIYGDAGSVGIGASSELVLNAGQKVTVSGSEMNIQAPVVMNYNMISGCSMVSGLDLPSNSWDATNKSYVDGLLAGKLNLTGGTMTGSISMSGGSIMDLASPFSDGDAATKKYVDDQIGASGVTYVQQRFEVDATMISNGYVDLSHEAISGSVSMFVGRLAYFSDGASPDYSMSVEGGVTRITFANALVSGSEALEAGDVIHVRFVRE